jgi:hypothetical protein
MDFAEVKFCSRRKTFLAGSIFGMVALLLISFVLVGSTLADDADDHVKTILKFDTMIGDPGGSGPANVIRGFQGAGAPWTILRSVNGRLKTDGRLTIIVRGLVIPPPTLNNVNPVPFFGAILSCQDPTDSTKSVLFPAGLFPATTGAGAGDANIVAKLKLPDQCTAPIILITSPPSPGAPNGVWFAATGFPSTNDHDKDNQ